MVISAVLALLIQGTPPAAACEPADTTWPTKKWQVAAPEALGLDPDSLKRIVARARAMPAVTSILVVRHGQIALEQYFHGGSRGQPVPVASITKSITSFLVGIALERGLVSSLDQPIIELLPQLAPPAGRPSGTITIRQLLTMTSGLSDQWYEQKPLQLRIMNKPGSRFHYSNEGVQLLVRAIAQSGKRNVLDFSREVLWEPLGMDVDQSRWPKLEPDGSGDGAGGLILTTRELGKVGLLALRDGCWEGKQVVPASYVRASTTWQVDGGIPEPDGRGYGFLFWITAGGIPYMAGYGGQYVVVYRALDLVAVITASVDVPTVDWNGQFQLITGVTGAVRP